MFKRDNIFKKSPVIISLIISAITVILYHIPFFQHAIPQIDFSTFSGCLLSFNLVVLLFVLNAFVTYLLYSIFRGGAKYIIIVTFIINSVALYFINTFGVYLDKTMIGNVFNTNVEESTSFFSWALVAYIIFLGILPSVFIFFFKPIKETFKRFIIQTGIVLLFMGAFSWANASNWLWVDKNVPILGSLAMPWCYVVNSVRYASDKYENSKEAAPLPDIIVKEEGKSAVILMIGESARQKNFSLYGYEQETNPRLSQIPDLHVYNAESAATYTTAGVKAMLDYKPTGKYIEPLTSYLHRNGFNVVWRTTNSGQPKMQVNKWQSYAELKELAEKDGLDPNYDESLLSCITDEITASESDKSLIVLHTSTSHGPTYYKKYPEQFAKFTPVCTGVELSKCDHQEVINAYDNTIVYTDWLIAELIQRVSTLEGYKVTVLFVSDHGESIGEQNLYMHGVPKSIAPEEQYKIPFLVWTNDKGMQFKNKDLVTQYAVFHTIMDALGLDSPIYNSDLSLIQ